MLQNYFVVAFRNLVRQRDYALLNVLGMSLSVACCILIFTVIRHHLSFDTHHQNVERMARIVMDIKTEKLMPFSGTPTPMAKALREECAFLEKAAMRTDIYEVLVTIANAQGGKDKYKEQEKFAWVEPEYLEMLNLPLLSGDIRSLSEPNTVMLTANLASKYFGNVDPLDKTLRINNNIDLRVVGILRDLPQNTDYKDEILGSWESLKSRPEMSLGLDLWGAARGGNYCFVLLKQGYELADLQALMLQISKKYPHPDSADFFQYKAKALTALHFDTEYGFNVNKKHLWALGFIGLFLLITACVNFVNMATAQALTRIREVGVRKSLGSTRGQLFWQFMLETGLIVLASLVIGALLAQLALPYLNAWLDENLRFNARLLATLGLFLTALGIVLTFLAGFYPGMMQSGFSPITALKSTFNAPKTGGFSLRRVLVATQFGISQTLIIGAAVITAQIHFAQNADWGFKPGAMLTLEVPEPANKTNLQQQLQQIVGVQHVSLCYQPPAAKSNNHSGVRFDNRPAFEPWLVSNKPVDDQYIQTFGLQLVAGRNLHPGDTVREFVVNETFVKKLNLTSPEDVLNKNITLDGTTAPIVGVVRDFHNWSLQEPIAAITFSTFAAGYETCAIQLSPGNPAPVLAQIRKVWEKNYPDHAYEHHFMDERMEEFLEDEALILNLINAFAGIAIFIGCIGLYGLASFMVARKRKEVGIRKTLGAGIPVILWLFFKEYARLIVIAFMLAAPVARLAMNAWLEDYAYRISISAGIFGISLLTTFLVAILTVGVQSARAALANPVESLRSE
ncbi:MAG: ABC transporter permease [Saprospiraceae bacterium]|nr:ABC transporter permease [Saprospiraceae bacterium]